LYKEVALVVVTLILFANAVSPIILLFTFTKVPPARFIPQQSGEINVALPTTSIPLIILFEILKPILKEDIDDDILSMLTNIDDTETKEKVLKFLQTVNKKEDKEELSQIKSEISPKSFKIIHDKIEPYLLNKGLPEDKILTLIAKFAKEDEEEDLIKYYQKSHKFDVNTDLSILDIPKSELNPNTVNSIYGLMRGASGTKGVGKEEYFLVAF
jgi:hypothetical protein